MMTDEKLAKLRSKLPYAYGSQLKKITGKSKSAIYQALMGKINSPLIIEAAIKLAKKSDQTKRDLNRRISEL